MMLTEFYDSLKHGDKVRVQFRDAISSGKTVALTVTSGHRVVGKAKVGRIILKPTNLERRNVVKFYLYKRGDDVSFAIGDMAAVVIGFEKVGV